MKIMCCYCGVYFAKGIFTIPSNNPVIEDEWKKQIPGCEELLKVSKNLPLCYNHFAETDVIKEDIYVINGKSVSVPRTKWSLAPNSVPSIFNDNTLSFGVSRLLKGRLQQQDASLNTIKDCGTATASFDMESSTIAINNNNSEVPVQQLLPYSTLQTQHNFKQSSIEKNNPSILYQSHEMNNGHKTFFEADIPTDSSSAVITREKISLEQNTATSANTNLGCCDVGGISASGVSQFNHENHNVAVGGTTPTPVDGPIVGVFVMIPNSIKLPGENWYSVRGAEQILFCCESIFKEEVMVIRKGVKIDVKAKSISFFVYQDALPLDKELPCGLYRNFETVNSLNETLKFFDALPLCTGIDDVPYYIVKDCSTDFGILKNGFWHSTACTVFPDSREVQGLCGSCFSFKQALLLRYFQQGLNPSTSVANKKYVVNKYLSNEELVKSKQETQKEIRILKQKLRRTESRLMEKEVEVRSMREKIVQVQGETTNAATNKRVKTKN